MFMKISLFFLGLHLVFFMIFLSSSSLCDVSVSYFVPSSSGSNFYALGGCLDSLSLTFLVMVSLVTFVVVLYSQVYMEHYSNKKFLFLLVLFFLSMVLLSLSGSFLMVMIGWDGLGISSIFLIMFYPNNVTLFNSVLTMFFNRLGDVFLVLVLSHFLINYNLFYFISSTEVSCLAIGGILICSFAKSAQFPLSSWLPAAMSAPTPISAMVHSSTLVTAGIFLLVKTGSMVSLHPFLVFFWYLFSMLTFMTGGFLASLDYDFKKMVAFSTMSQISMIMIFSSLSVTSLALLHMLFHAFFKTLLFCCSGLMFMYFLSLQQEKILKTLSPLVSFLFYLSIFSMTGLIFSSSFFSKDLVLEVFCSSLESATYIFFVLGSIFTLFYCSKMVTKCFQAPSVSSSTSNKKFNYLSFLFLFLVILFCGKLFHGFFFLDTLPFFSKTDLALSLFLFFGTFFILPNLKSSFFGYLPLEVSFMKFYSYSLLSKIFDTKVIMEVSFHPDMMFKTGNMPLLMKFRINKSYLTAYTFVLIFFFIFESTL